MDFQYVVGRNPVLEILKTDREIEKLYILKGELQGSINKIIGMAKDRNIVIQQVDKNKLDSLSEGNAHQGVVALVTSYTYVDIDDILNKAKEKEEPPFVVILDGLEDPHNLGSIIRTAECAGVHGIIIPKRRSAAVNQTVYKSSAGAVEHMLVAKVNNIVNAIEELKEKGLWIYGADMTGADYYKTSLNGGVALVIGNEGKGISRLVKEKCDVLVKIPMLGKVSSLNASNAASILMYEVVRQSNG
ncbi:23S rRNA (guanosine(2251)-2'-O)-methyltransferase RlmB [Tissierella pigra]|uniref:23S rRNA (Guanosine(2251)-2'-O)-methyltransferase RlmB n=1 Tax=Tissierella pigra TaxID=2607614 RepID=A0A6N7XFQ3_9FIRM|nr:23S rRNA (guanosine(2251)-2'-O)-methyltransferase RlmB [Tissierella pigra]MBU5425632.1 23S rRNA (guanosine(2251)-2'-O)-methyltransferase RlmB [Tissierella pigra]MSU00819.1 23S rRNA (guanosine(2251)-2'-O)-methyltransferase RlmB [Tissierella pigra]